MSNIKINIEDLFNLEDSVIYNPDNFKPVSYVSIDSRNIKRNSLFVAIIGKNFDGHDFVKEAIKKGASAVLINKKRLKFFDNIGVPIITVPDTTVAYGKLANIWRSKLKAKVIGITGSNGKTSTKDILYTLLSEKYKVLKTTANNNNNIGVPLTIFQARQNHDLLLLEIGTNHFGEIKYSAEIANPDYALITNIGNSHLEYLKNRKGVFKEKYELFRSTKKNNGVVFINTDDDLIKNALKDFENRVTFGFNGTPDIKAEIIEIDKGTGTHIKVYSKNLTMPFKLPLIGMSNAKNFLAALSIALKLGISQKDLKNALLKLKPTDKRLNILQSKIAVIINDTYNANPESMKEALKVLTTFEQYENKIVVLGDMFELGKDSERFHLQLSKEISKTSITEVYTIGKFMGIMSKNIQSKKLIKKHFKNRDQLRKFLSDKNFERSAILVKGSRGMKMEEFLNVLLANIEKA